MRTLLNWVPFAGVSSKVSKSTTTLSALWILASSILCIAGYGLTLASPTSIHTGHLCIVEKRALVFDLFNQLGETILYIHAQGIIHQDVKPSNILVVPVEGRYQVKVSAERERKRSQMQ